MICSAPLLTRLYSSEDFGLLAVFTSLLSLINVVSSLRYESAIPLPESDCEAVNISVLSLILVGISSFLCGVVVWQFGYPITEMLYLPVLAHYFWLLPLSVLLLGTYNVFNYWSVRTKNFSSIAGTRLFQSLTTVAIQCTTFNLGGIALICGQVMGQSIGTISLSRIWYARSMLRQVNLQEIINGASRYRRFPIFSTWAAFANTAGLQLPALIFSSVFGPVAVGLYSLSYRILSLPISLVGQAIGKVFLSYGSDAKNSGQLGGLVKKTHNILAQVSLPPTIFILITGPEIFAFVFGEPWREAGVIAQWLAPWLFLTFITSPLSILFTIRERQAQALALQLVLLAGRLLAIGIGIYFKSFTLSIACLSVSSIIGRVIMLVALVGDFYPKNFDIFKSTLGSLGSSLLISSPLIIFKLFFAGSTHMTVLLFASSLSISMLLYQYHMIFTSRPLSTNLKLNN